jgi:beta-lactamase superfamily II metal-dependent hydrolase
MNTHVEMVFWDVQHGHSTYIKSPNNRHIVIDLGTGDYSKNNLEFSPLRHLKYNYGIDQVDYVIITHPHLDHIDDILNFDLVKPRVFCRPKHISNELIMKELNDKDRAKFEKYCEINNQYNANIDGGPDDPDIPNNYSSMKILRFSSLSCTLDNFNNHSIITIIEYADIKVVIPGDNECCSYEELMKQEKFKTAIADADILLAPHHGRESGYNNEFVSLINPRLSIVSDGRFCDTSANGRYSQKSRGWTVHKSDGTSSERKCLTTNSDGEVYVQFGFKSDNKRFLSVNIS